MGHDDFGITLGSKQHPYYVIVEHIVREPVMPSDQVPTWAKPLFDQVALILEDGKDMKQSTKDLVDAYTVLAAKVSELEAAMDQLKAAQDDGSDEEAIRSLTALVSGKVDEVSTHLPVVAAAVKPVVSAPADPSPVVLSTDPVSTTAASPADVNADLKK